MTKDTNNDSSEHPNSANWCQVRETTLMLEVATGQIEAAMKESNSSVDVLTDNFTTMAGYMSMIASTLALLPEEGEVGDTKKNVVEAANHVAGMVHQSIVAFQFYDKLSQRLSHVTHSLSALNDLVADKERVLSPQEWVVLREKIRSKYTSVDECAMFDAVIGGMTVHEALQHYVLEMKDKGSDIDLF